jgi:hypothetical protein
LELLDFKVSYHRENKPALNSTAEESGLYS